MLTGPEHDRGLFTLNIIWFAMLGSLVMYLALGFFIGTISEAIVDDATCSILRPVLYIFSFIVLLAIGPVRKRLLATRMQGGPAQAPHQSGLQHYSVAIIVSLAMAESIGIAGLFLFLLGQNPIDLFLLIAASAAAMFLFRPNKEELREFSASAQTDADAPESQV